MPTNLKTKLRIHIVDDTGKDENCLPYISHENAHMSGIYDQTYLPKKFWGNEKIKIMFEALTEYEVRKYKIIEKSHPTENVKKLIRFVQLNFNNVRLNKFEAKSAIDSFEQFLKLNIEIEKEHIREIKWRDEGIKSRDNFQEKSDAMLLDAYKTLLPIQEIEGSHIPKKDLNRVKQCLKRFVKGDIKELQQYYFDKKRGLL